jgi:hypothetical protein
MSDRYGVNAYNYDDLERAFDKEQIDAAYIGIPKQSRPLGRQRMRLNINPKRKDQSQAKMQAHPEMSPLKSTRKQTCSVCSTPRS